MTLSIRLRTVTLLLVLATATANTQDTNAGGAYQTLVRATGEKNFFAMAEGRINGDPSVRDLIVANSTGSVFVVTDGAASGSGLSNLPEAIRLDLNTSNPRLAIGRLLGTDQAQVIASSQTLVVVAGPVTTSAGTPRITFHSSVGGMRFTDVAAGDINGDGYEDLLIGESNLSRVLVVFGRADLTSRDFATTPPDTVITNVINGGPLAIGDVATDGKADILIGQPFDGAGAVYLIKGGAAFPSRLSLPTAADAVFSGVHSGEGAGYSLEVADFNGDVIPDIVIGAHNPSGEQAGRVYIVAGEGSPASRSLNTADATIMSPVVHTGRFAQGLATGDVNRDNYQDVLVRGAEAVYVYYGRWPSYDSGAVRATQVSGYDRVISCCIGGAAGTSLLRDAVVFDRGGDGSDIVLANADGIMFFSSDKAATLAGPAVIEQSLVVGTSTVRTVQIQNVGTKAVSWTLVIDDLNSGGAGYRPEWISVSPMRGSLAPGATANLQLTLRAVAGRPFEAVLTVVPENRPSQHFLYIPTFLTVTGGVQ